jgi:hypothetical protein
MTALASPVDLDRPALAAAAAGALNDRLAAEPTVTPGMAAAVRAFTSAVRETPLERWVMADPYLALLVHRAVLEAGAAADSADRDGLRLALERLAHVLASLGEAEEVGEGRTPKDLARWLVEAVDAPQRDLADLLGVDLRRLQRWLSARERTQPDGEEARRVRAVARLVAQLRHAFTGAGVLAWFDWPRPDLDGATPRELLADPVRLPDLVLAAGSTRSTTLA